MKYVFDKKWFEKHQKILLFLLNAPVIKIWFRWILRIKKFDCSLKTKISEIAPNYFGYNERMILVDYLKFKDGHRELFNKLNKQHRKLYKKLELVKGLAQEKTRNFRTHSKYSKRILNAFYPIWILFHIWDILIANNFIPAWNLGFDTLTVSPDANPETTSVDGSVIQSYGAGSGVVWSTLVADAGNGKDDSSGTHNIIYIYADTGSDKWRQLGRGIFLFDTSALPDTANISAATFSLMGNPGLKSDGCSCTPNINVYASTPASNTALANGDFAQIGNTALCDTPVTYASWSNTVYNDFALNNTGIAAISKTGITKLGVRNPSKDVAGVAPTWSNSCESYLGCCSADRAGTSEDPKLVITYSVGQIISVLDTINATENKLANLTSILTNTLNISESMSAFRGIFSIVSDSISMAESKLASIGAVISETITITEQRFLNLVSKISDTLNLSETITALRGLTAIVQDTIQMTGSFIGNLTSKITDTMRMVENVAASLLWAKRTKPNAPTWTARTKPTTNFTKRTPPTTNWTKRTKP